MVNREALREFLIVGLFLVAATSLIAVTGFDLTVERFFYQADWAGRVLDPWRSLYLFGAIPGFVMGAVALATLCAGFFWRHAHPYRKGALFLVLLLVLGPGLVVNTCFKDHWGRPRPVHLLIFNGHEAMPYHQVWEPGRSGEGRSFPCGHASIAFYLFGPYFVLRRRAPRQARLVLIGGLGYGLTMGVARMSQGGHFPSDVLWAGGIVYLIGVLLYYLLGLHCGPASQGGST